MINITGQDPPPPPKRHYDVKRTNHSLEMPPYKRHKIRIINILHIFGLQDYLQQSSWGLVQVVLLVSVSLSLVAVESGHLGADRKAVWGIQTHVCHQSNSVQNLTKNLMGVFYYPWSRK